MGRYRSLGLVMGKRGFTLLELLIVSVIIGVLSIFAVTHYISTREHALGKEAVANLRLIAAAERIWRMENGGQNFVACQCTIANPCNNANGCNTLLRLSLDNRNWEYWVDALPGPAFVAWATRNGAGGLLNCEYQFANVNVNPIPNDDCR
ncbi:MAG: prepilin-type N-terminal cleavage/methylation domain-containing protein [Candidatus Omnitrophica bacterium]|nr:prepilin-type N-terminal cleavage/methylation domain-containing protein [Candidatus Omnitrophota bacterium]